MSALGELRPSAVVFDAGGILLLPDPDAIREALEPFGVAPDDETCRRGHYESVRELDSSDGPVDWVQVDQRLAGLLGVDDEHLEAAGRSFEHIYLFQDWIPVPGAAEALRTLAAAGLRLAIVSNASGTVEEQLATHRICSVRGGEAAEVAVVVDSHLVGVEKPDPAIFTFALDALGLAAEQCIYVGDTVRFDVVGSRAAGLHPVHLDPYGLCPDEDHAHVESLDDLVGQVVGGQAAASR